MEDIKFKNMIILKDLPSNMVEEAYIVLKSNKMIKKLQKTDKKINKEGNFEDENKENQYVLKEAEMVVSNYIKEIETSEKNTKTDTKKNKRIKRYAFLSSIIIILQFILLIIK